MKSVKRKKKKKKNIGEINFVKKRYQEKKITMEFCKNIKPLCVESDWPIWKRKVKDLLDFYEGALDVVEHRITKPEPLEEGITEAQEKEHKKRCDFYRKANNYAKSLITNTISDDIFMKVMDKESACDVWQALHQQFEATSKDQLFKMCTELFSFEWMAESDVSTHISKLKSLWNEINAGLVIKGEKKLPELLLICKILHILPKSFEMFKSSWMMLTRDEDKSLDELLMQLCLFERNFKKSEDTISEKQEALVLNEKRKNKNFANGKKDDICHYCKKKGHWIKDCRKWIADGKPSKSKQLDTSHSNVALHSVSNEVNLSTSVSDWWVDNGATRHVTNAKEFFIDYEAFKEPHSIQAAGKETLSAMGKGTIQVLSKVNNAEKTVELYDVWYVPGISRNLFSVLASHDRNPSSKFYSTIKKCKLDLNGETILCGHREPNGTLYRIDFRPVSANQCVSFSVENSKLQLYHERWGHQDKRHVKEKLEKEMGIRVKNNSEICEPCVFGKLSRLPFGRRETAKAPGELISTDVCGPFPSSFREYKYLMVYEDDYTKFRYGYVVKNKSDVKDTLIKMLAHARSQGHTVKTLLSDNGGEFNNAEVKKILAKHGVSQRFTAPYTPQQNGGAERENRTIVEMARTFMNSNKNVEFPLSLWAEFVKSAIYILNRTGKSSEKDKSPFELWCDKKPRIKHLRIIGSKCYVHVPSQRRKKMDKKATVGYLVGYDGDERYRVYIKEQNIVEISRDVIFSEEINGCANEEVKEDEVVEEQNNKNSNNIQEKNGKEISIRIGPYNHEGEEQDEYQQELVKEKAVQDAEPLESHNENQDSTNDIEDFEEQDAELQDGDNENQDSTSDLEDFEGFEEIQRKKRRRDELDDTCDNTIVKRLRNRTVIISNCVSDEMVMMAHDFVCQTEPPSRYLEAVESEERINWIQAMKSEMNSLIENKTWVLTNLPNGAKALPSKWVYRVKTKSDGTIEKYKARLVVKGFKQKEGEDYDETFSPVARMSSIRSVLSIAATERLHLSQFDVSTAFLYGELNETVYMEQPEGFNDGSNRVCLLKRSLYGLKQAPRCWNKRMGDFLKKHGFKANSADSCLFIREKDGKKLILALYVDDGLVAASDKEELEHFLNSLKSEFKIVSNEASYFLGIKIENSNDQIRISQKSYATKILERFNFSECRPVSTPMENTVKCISKPGKARIEFPYRQAVGALMYLMLGTRPDLAYSVGYLSRHLDNYTCEDIQKLKRVFRYIAGSIDVGIAYNKEGPKLLECYSDADYGGCVTTGRSTTGVVATYAGGALSWMSQRQPTVSTSTTEAEIIAASEAAKEVIWLKRLFKDIINYKDIPIINIDNTAAIRLSKNPEFHKRTKHIDLKHFFVREKVTEGLLSTTQVSTENQLADMMTKPLPKSRLQYLCTRLNII